MVVKFMPNEKGTPFGKLADAEVHFTEGLLQGMKLMGFIVWERKGGGGRIVTFPSRTYSVNGERRSYSLLRATHELSAQDGIRDLVLRAYSEFVKETADS